MVDAKSNLEQTQFEGLIETCLAHLGETERPLSWQVYPGTISIVLANHEKKVLNRDQMQQLHTAAVLAAEAKAAAEAEVSVKAAAAGKKK